MPPAATQGCTAELLAGFQTALAAQLGVSAESDTVTCLPAARRRLAAVSVALAAQVVFASPTRLQTATQAVNAGLNAGTFAKSLSSKLPAAGDCLLPCRAECTPGRHPMHGVHVGMHLGMRSVHPSG